jgi:hypothetical protein
MSFGSGPTANRPRITSRNDIPRHMPLAVRPARLPDVAPPQRPKQAQDPVDQGRIRMWQDRPPPVPAEKTREAVGHSRRFVHLGHRRGRRRNKRPLAEPSAHKSRRRLPQPSRPALPSGPLSPKGAAGAVQAAPERPADIRRRAGCLLLRRLLRQPKSPDTNPASLHFRRDRRRCVPCLRARAARPPVAPRAQLGL